MRGAVARRRALLRLRFCALESTNKNPAINTTAKMMTADFRIKVSVILNSSKTSFEGCLHNYRGCFAPQPNAITFNPGITRRSLPLVPINGGRPQFEAADRSATVSVALFF